MQGRLSGREVSLCGDAVGNPAHIAPLPGSGLRSLSAATTALGRTRLAIAQAVLG